MAAVVTTLRVPEDSLVVVESFCAYHFAIGFEHIFLCVDDGHDTSSSSSHSASASRSASGSLRSKSAADADRELLSKATATAEVADQILPPRENDFFAWLAEAYGSHITIIRSHECESLQRELCSEAFSKANEGNFRLQEVQIRQVLNVDMCVRLAAKNAADKGLFPAPVPVPVPFPFPVNSALSSTPISSSPMSALQWLLHIDIDELFFCGPSTSSRSAPEHFAALTAQRIGTLTYANHEAVPESLDCSDYFSTLTLFRRHHFQLPLGRATSDGMDYWRRRTTHGQYFLFYDCGKSAVRLGVGAVAKDVHRFTLSATIASIASSEHEQSGERVPVPVPRLLVKSALADPRHLCTDQLLSLEGGWPCVLHYCCPGVRWLTSKYSFLGDFPDHWKMPGGAVLPIAPSFHLESRNMVQTGSQQQIEEYFRAQVMMPAGAEAEAEQAAQLASGVLMRIEIPARFLELARDRGMYRSPSLTPVQRGEPALPTGDSRIERLRQLLDEAQAATTGREKLACSAIPETAAPLRALSLGARVKVGPRAGMGDGGGGGSTLSEADRLRILSQSLLQFL